uniref:Uncharacterized protein n=1 Tax=Lactuca sativa TaxID=4236 RepID=A0A9R1X8J2_LACSA|nr:hypothetical protein LSAT_V11C600330560 [Lactuca sativa]
MVPSYVSLSYYMYMVQLAGKMSQFPLKGVPTRPHKHMHRLLQRSTKEASSPALSSTSVPQCGTESAPRSTPSFGIVSAPRSTPASTTAPLTTSTSTPTFTRTTSTPLLFGTISAPQSTPSSTTAPSYTSVSTPTFTSATSTPLMFGTLSTTSSTPAPSSTQARSSSPLSTPAPSSTPSSIPLPSSTPSFGADPQTPLDEQNETREGRLRITVQAKELSPLGKCSNIITKTFHDKVDPNGDKWATLSEETKQFYWEEFQEHRSFMITQMLLCIVEKCYWDVAVDNSIKAAWEHKAKERYRQYIYDMSNRNPTHEKPSHIEQQVWNAWNAIWNSEERKGVVGGKAPPTHNGGSASHKQIALDMEEYTGKAPSVYDVFMFTHTKDHDGKTFLDDKAKKVHDFIESRRADLELLGEEVDENELFYTAVGGHDCKRRIYGLGSYGRSIFPIDSSKTCSSQDTNYEKHHLETKIQKLEETIVQQRIELDEVRNTINDMRNATN